VRKPKLRLTVGLMMILVAVSASVFWAIEYSRRTRVVFDNRSPSKVRDVTVTYAGRVKHLGPIEPRTRLEARVPSPSGEPIRVAWDVQGNPGEKDRHIEAPAVSTSDPGGSVSIGWDGP
jgi:hypothetical protein